MNELSVSDALALGNNRGGFGNNGDGWWIILLFILLGGWGNRGFGNGGAASVGGNELYPWLNQTDTINGGFRDQMLQSGITGVQQSVTAGFANAATQLCQCCGEMQMALANGFAGVNAGMAAGFAGAETAANARQMANMNQQYANTTAMMQGFNGLQSQLAECCCENRLATANQTATILAEHCSDRATLSDGVRDIIASQTAGVQRILDQMCQDRIAQKDDEIAQLRTQIQVQNLAASQTAQTATILADNARQTTMLEQYLNPVPIPSYQVTNPNCCQQSFGCGCAA